MTALSPEHMARQRWDSVPPGSNAAGRAAAALRREFEAISARRRALGLTVPALAYTARLRTSRVCRPDGVALLRIEWVLRRLEDGWSLQQVRDATRRGAASGGTREQSSRQAVEYRLRDGTVPAAVVGDVSALAGGGGGHRK